MNNTAKLVVSFLLAMPLFSTYPLHAQDQCDQLIGTWEYQEEEEEGMAMISKDHVIWIKTDKDRQSFENNPPTESERASAYSTLSASGGSYTCEANVATYTHHYSGNPALIGTSFKWEFEIEGEIQKYWMLDAQGQRGWMGMARRMKM